MPSDKSSSSNAARRYKPLSPQQKAKLPHIQWDEANIKATYHPPDKVSRLSNHDDENCSIDYARAKIIRTQTGTRIGGALWALFSVILLVHPGIRDSIV